MSRVTRTPWKVVALALLFSLLLAACGSDDGDGKATSGGEDSVAIGFVGALTGENANLGLNARDGMKVAVNEENAKGGTQVTIKEFDTAGDPAQASTIQDRFLNDDSIVAIVGPVFSGETKALLPSLQDAGLLMISPSATNKDLPTVVPNSTVFHRIIADDALQAAGIVTYLNSLNPRPRGVAYVNDNSEYGKGLADDVEKNATAKGLPRAISATVDPKAQDFSATVNALKGANPSHIFYGGYYAEAGRLKKQLTDAGVTAQFVSGDGSLDPGFISAAGAAAANGSRLSCPCNLALPASRGELKAFYDRFNQEIGREPGLYSPEGYDAAKILVQGIKAGNEDRPSMVQYAESLPPYQGISKPIEFEPDGNLKSKSFFVFQVQDGKIAPLQEINAAS